MTRGVVPRQPAKTGRQAGVRRGASTRKPLQPQPRGKGRVGTGLRPVQNNRSLPAKNKTTARAYDPLAAERISSVTNLSLLSV